MPISAQPAESRKNADAHWPPIANTLGVGVLYLALPPRLAFGPNWLLLVILACFLVPLAHFGRTHRHSALESLRVVLSIIITFALLWSLGMLIAGLPGHKDAPSDLFRSGAALWTANILVFASWYWKLDAGGPHKRSLRDKHEEGSFLFPQMSTDMTDSKNRPWRPWFVDYLFLAFNTSTAFSPTDVAPLTSWAKVLMMIQSLISVGTITLVFARAVNLL